VGGLLDTQRSSACTSRSDETSPPRGRSSPLRSPSTVTRPRWSPPRAGFGERDRGTGSLPPGITPARTRTTRSNATAAASRHGSGRRRAQDHRTASVVIRGHAFIQNLRRGH